MSVKHKLCRSCQRVKQREDFARSKQGAGGLHHYCRECSAERFRKWAAANRDRRISYRRRYDAENSERKAAKARQWRKDNRSHVAAYSRQYNAENADRRLEWQRAARLRNPRPTEAKRKAAKLQATPAWADDAEMRRLYAEASASGLEIDHVVPLCSKYVCGLHCEANLQPLTRSENAAKNNRWWPDMFEAQD